ncbi:lysophospholipid acyltransferase 2-like [Hyperolius riggenbachi]|uniref:lysophospholipid acyltransferase 2-like n=1 Tax=Hyperolius riggenbachi TaxID=752182 RepID=UPI0035A3CFA4
MEAAAGVSADGAPLHSTVWYMVTNLPTEQRIFLLGQLSALLLAFLFRYCLPPSQYGPRIRHSVASILGICLSIYCFGWLTYFLIGEVIICYLMLLFIDPRKIHVYTFFLSMGLLTFFHIRRYAYPFIDDLDFTVMLMMLTQKISKVGFEYHDGSLLNDQSLSPSQRRLAIRSPPGLLPYFSYTVGFLGLLAGPVCSFRDYQIFIHGEGKKGNPNVAVCKKLLLCCVLLAIHVTVSDLFPISIDPKSSIIGQFSNLYLAGASKRPKYYFAWTLADAINNAAGFGFNGISEDGTERWDSLSNLNILKIETATSFKMYIDNWNIQTAVWLKEVCYDRCPYNPLLATFVLSAAWHGVHPGYYLTFLTAAPVSLAARRVRQNVRPWFQHTVLHRSMYSVITWACTQIMMTYTVAPFILLELGPSLQLYRSFYFSLHILPVLLLVVLPQRKRPPAAKESSTAPSCDRNDNHLKKEM